MLWWRNLLKSLLCVRNGRILCLRNGKIVPTRSPSIPPCHSAASCRVIKLYLSLSLSLSLYLTCLPVSSSSIKSLICHQNHHPHHLSTYCYCCQQCNFYKKVFCLFVVTFLACLQLISNNEEQTCLLLNQSLELDELEELEQHLGKIIVTSKILQATIFNCGAQVNHFQLQLTKIAKLL